MWTQVFYTTTDRHDIWVGTDQETYLVDAYLKVEGGIRYLSRNYEDCPNLEAIISELDSAVFSPRPYQLGQNNDGSIDSCVTSLFWDFCQRQGHDAIALYREAYQKEDGEDYQDPDFDRIIRIASWEGVSYPQRWDETTRQRLIKSLDEINENQLAELLANLQLKEDSRQTPHPNKELHLLTFKVKESSFNKPGEIIDGNKIRVGLYVTISDAIFVEADIPVPPSREIDLAVVEEKIREQIFPAVAAYLKEREAEKLEIGFEGVSHPDLFQILSE